MLMTLEGYGQRSSDNGWVWGKRGSDNGSPPRLRQGLKRGVRDGLRGCAFTGACWNNGHEVTQGIL